MIQNVNFDIDNFISNAKIIQDSINEAMTYNTDLNPNQKEEMFRSDLKTRANNQNYDLEDDNPKSKLTKNTHQMQTHYQNNGSDIEARNHSQQPRQ